MDFGSSHVYLPIKPGGPSIPDIDVSSGIQQDSAGASAVTSEELVETAAATLSLPDKSTKGGATLTYKDAFLDVKNIYNLTEHVVDWFGLGTQLDITNSRLKKIFEENLTVDGRRREMIVSWLYGDPEASWDKLSKALVRVDHRVLADRIEREILPLQVEACGPAVNQVLLQSVPGTFNPRGSTKKGAPPPMIGHSLSLDPRKESYTVNFVDGLRDATNPQPSRKYKRRSDKDTNILMIKFGALSKPCKVHTGDPVICSNDQCAAVLNYHSKIIKETGVEGNVWVCEFCSTKNTIEIEAGEIPKEGDILYLDQPQHSSKHDSLASGITKDSIVVFCVDTSGSMGVTTEVPGYKELKGHERLTKLKEIYAGSGIQYMPGQYRNVTYVSRLQCVQAAIDHQLTTLARNNPSQRVAIVMFGDEVTVTGDGKPENEVLFVGEKLWKESAMLKLTEVIPTPSPIRESTRLLNEKIFSIEEEGQTALGGALLVSVELAKRAPGSKVILCTDGLANRGVGNLDGHDQKCIDSSIAFYKKLGMAAKESSVSVSVLTIKGTECDLLHLGEVANLSGGNVEVVDPMSLSEEFINILSTSVVAVRVNAKIVLHSTLSFKDGDGKSTLSVPVGNVVDTTKLMYEFSSSERNAGADDYKELQEVPFQVQIKYTSLDGQQCLRVFTEARPTTADREVASEGAKNDVLLAYSLKKEGNSILQTKSASMGFRPRAKLMRAQSANYYSSQHYAEDYCGEAEGDFSLNLVPNSPAIRHAPAYQQSRARLSLRKACDSLDSFKRAYPLRGEINADEVAATAFQQVKGELDPTGASRCTIKVQKHDITLSNEGYGFGFLVCPGREEGTIVQSLVPNGVAWKDGKLQKGDKILTIDGENVESMPHQDVVKKIRLLNESANSITLCVMREEVCQRNLSTEKDRAEHTEQVSVSLQSEGLNSLGITFQFDDSQQLIIEEIKPDGIAAKDCRLKVRDTVLEINGEAASGKTHDDIVMIVKCIEESNGSMVVLVRREIPVSRRKRLSRSNPPELMKHLRVSSLTQPQTTEQKPTDHVVKICLHNQGRGFGFTVQEAADKSIVVSKIFPEGVAHTDGRLRANDKLLEMNGSLVSGMTYKEVIAMLRALNDDDHSTVDLKVERN